MGFGFHLILIFLVLPFSALLLLFWAGSQKKMYGELLGCIWGGIFCLILLVSILKVFWTKKKVERHDIYGTYVIDRTQFPGRQADWQYNHFRFEITKQDELIFYQTNGAKIIHADTAKVEFLTQYRNNRIYIERSRGMHHIISQSPTLYRQVWSFYYVFRSPHFGNVFFRKGKWKPL